MSASLSVNLISYEYIYMRSSVKCKYFLQKQTKNKQNSFRIIYSSRIEFNQDHSGHVSISVIFGKSEFYGLRAQAIFGKLLRNENIFFKYSKCEYDIYSSLTAFIIK